MNRTLAVVTTLVAVLGPGGPAVAQHSADDVHEAVRDVLDPDVIVRGSVLQHREATLVLRGDDGHVYTINTAGLDAAALARLKEGRPVRVALKSGSPGAMPIASAVEAIEVQPSAAVAGRAVERLHGFVDRVGLGTLTVTTDAGFEVTVETTRVAEPVRVRPGDAVTIVGWMLEGHSERFVAERILTDTVRTPGATPPAGR
jgi:hypothetical protein